MCFEFDYGSYSTDHQFESIEDAIKAAYAEGDVKVVCLILDDEVGNYETVWSAKEEANRYDFSNYTRDDILEDIFRFMDTLEDSDIITSTEKCILAKLEIRWKEIIRQEVDNG